MADDIQLSGDPPTSMEQFVECRYKDQNYTDDKHGIEHKCRYCDNNDKCIYENCVFDGQEGPKVANRHWLKCIICQSDMDLDPKHVDVPICDRCRARMQFAEKLPFKCILCGSSQSKPSAIMFSTLCDKCLMQYVFNKDCKVVGHATLVRIPSMKKGYDKA